MSSKNFKYFKKSSMTKLITTDPNDKIIIDYIKKVRLAKNITQDQLAKIAGVSKSLIGQTETYQRKYSSSTLEKIFKALNIELPREQENLEFNKLIKSITTNKVIIGLATIKEWLQFYVSDRFISDSENMFKLQFKSKKELVIGKDHFSNHFLDDFNKNNQKYYAVIINDDSLMPIAHKGNYIIIKFIENSNIPVLNKKPLILVFEDLNNNNFVKHVKIIRNRDENFIYVFDLIPSVNNHFPCSLENDYYFKEGELKIIGQVVCIIDPNPKVIEF